MLKRLFSILDLKTEIEMDCPSFNVEDYRQPHESDNEWNLKSRFLLLHKDKFTLQRLLCLASCFLNIECYGNTYPGPVMQQIKELSEEMSDELHEHRDSKTKYTAVQFVKAEEPISSSSISKSNRNDPKYPSMTFVKSSDNYESTKVEKAPSATKSQPDECFSEKQFIHKTKLAKQKFGLGAEPESRKKFTCEPEEAMQNLYSKESTSTSLTSRSNINELQYPSMSFVKSTDDFESRPSKVEKSPPATKESVLKFKRVANYIKLLKKKNAAKLIREENAANSISLVNMAVQKIQVNAVVDFLFKNGVFICELMLDGVHMSSGTGNNKKSAKQDAFEKCISLLENPVFHIEEHSGTKFLKSVNDFDAKPNLTTDFEPPAPKRLKNEESKCTSQSIQGSFETGLASFDICETPGENARLEKFSQLGTVYRRLKSSQQNPSQIIHMAVQKCQMALEVTFGQTTKCFLCNIQIDSVLVAQGTASNKKTAKANAFKICAGILENPYLRIQQPNPTLLVLESSDHPYSGKKLKQHKQGSNNMPKPNGSNSSPSIPDFIIIQNKFSDDHMLSSAAVLERSSAINKVLVQYEYFDLSNGVQCNIYLGNEQVSDVTAFTKQEAKELAAGEALDMLRKHCWSIQIKQFADTSDLGISKEELIGDVNKLSESIPDSNVGNKLLKKMGWTGGGVGREGQGIAEPVSVSGVVNRSGLGLQAEKGIGKDFISKIKTILTDYARSSKFEDLTFTKEFSKDERALIHKESLKIGLKSHSHGKDEERYLIVSRKRNAQELLQYVKNMGGETPKYKVIPPSLKI